MGKKDKLPRGAGRVPEWWLEITPHDTLYLAEDEAQRKAAYEEKVKFARLAAEQDLLQKYGGEGFPNWNPATDGPRTNDEEKEWVSKGYQRNEKNEWIDDSGVPLEGRQFKGQMPPGYLPGEYIQDFQGGSIGHGGLNPAKYERDKDKDWKKPDWMAVKLRSTGTGGAIRQGDDVDRPITKGDGTRVARNTDEDRGDKKSIEQLAEEEAAAEIYEDEEANEFVDPTAPAKATVHQSTPKATDELQAILNRRKNEDEHGALESPLPAKNTTISLKASDELQAILNKRKQVSD